MDWQPIETAPKDCSTILICAKSPLYDQPRAYMARWSIPYEAAPDDQCWWDLNTVPGLPGRSVMPPEWVSHWMPLPPPPSDAGGAG